MPIAAQPRRWRWSLGISLIAHAVLALGVWVAPDMNPPEGGGWSPVRADDRELDVRVMDIFEPLDVVSPGVVQLAPAPSTAAPVPSVEPPVSAGQTASGPPAKPAAMQLGGATSSGDMDLLAPSGGNDGVGGPIFPVPGAAKSVVYVIDRSGSM